ncbi:MAG: carbohydrate kinase [Opitutales bacterium]|nr:carbohydrate kinase [Opitutales bacterium]
MSVPPRIVCYGETLWDVLPQGIFLGGAPLNVACHLAMWGVPIALISSVGNDFLGDEALKRLQTKGVDTRFIGRQNNRPTGTVKVRIDASGIPQYDFTEPVAYDQIKTNRLMVDAVSGAFAFVYGTLAQRGRGNTKSLNDLLQCRGPLKVYDVNLRPPCMNRSLVLELAADADLLKLNLEELAWIMDTGLQYISLPAATKAISEKTETTRICVTLGDQGVFYYDSGRTWQVPAPPVEVRDTVGAGDAFLAKLLYGLMLQMTVDEMLSDSCAYGASVAAINGALPVAEMVAL